MTPEEIPLGIYTHIYFSFALIDPVTYRMAHMDAGTALLYDRVAQVASRQPGLNVWIAIGGWVSRLAEATRKSCVLGADPLCRQCALFAQSLFSCAGAHSLYRNDDDQPTRWTFSDIARSITAQDTFFDSLVTFLKKHDFDGVDIDWEYPVAPDRSGRPEDFENLVTFLRRLRERLYSLGPNRHGRPYGLSITLVSFESRSVCRRIAN